MEHVGKSEAELVVEEIISTVSTAENGGEEPTSLMPPRHSHNETNHEDNNMKPTAEHQHEIQDNDCSETMLDQMDTCVGCVEGVEVQQAFEEELGQHDLVELSFAPTPHQSLSTTEAALIRLQIMENQQNQQQEGQDKGFKSLQDIDLLNICGSDEDLSVSRACASSSSSPDVPGRAATPSPSTKNEEADTSMDTADVSFMSAAGDADNNDGDLPHCAVCLDEAIATNRTHYCAKELPCCSGITICTACILVLTAPTGKGASRSRVGRCPGCQSWIEATAPKSPEQSELEISTIAVAGKCQVCCQVKEQLVEDAEVCDACFLGKRDPLLYQCEACNVTQRIEHPMYRYQPSPDKFGSVSWACRSCETFTHWKILKNQVPLIPVGDTPKNWGDDYLALARRRVQQTRTELAKSQVNNKGCIIL